MSIVFTRGVLAFTALLDLTASLLIVVSYHAHTAEMNLALEWAILPWQALHVFSWFGALLAASGSPGRSFGQMMLAAYIGVILGDIVSLLWRAFLVTGTALFIRVTFWTTLSLVFVDGVALLFLWLSIVTTPEGEDKMRSPWTQSLQRRVLPWLWIFELVFVGLQIFVYALGLNRSPAFSRIILFEAAHGFIWLLHRAVTGGVLRDDGIRKLGWYWLGVLASGGLALAGAGASLLRIYYMLTDRDEPAALLSKLAVVSGWLQFSFGVGLMITALLQLLTLGSIMSSERPGSLPLVEGKE